MKASFVPNIGLSASGYNSGINMIALMVNFTICGPASIYVNLKNENCADQKLVHLTDDGLTTLIYR